MSDPTPTVPLGLSTQQIAEAFVTEARRGDAVILRATTACTAAEIAQMQAWARTELPGVPVMVIDGTRFGVHVIRGGDR